VLSNRLRSLAAPALCAGIAALTLWPAHASASSPYLVVPEPAVAEASPAYRYANMTDEQALAELTRRQILYMPVDPVPGVRAPVRLTGRLHGVHFHSSLPPEERVTSVFEILDARLALALDDFAAVLERHEIDEVVHYTMYRPNVPPPPEPKHLGKGAIDETAHKSIREKPQARERPADVKQKKASTKKPSPKPSEKPAGRSGARNKKAGSAKPPAAVRPAPAKKGAAQKHAAQKNAAQKDAAQKHAAQKDAAQKKPRPLWAPPGTRHPAGLAIDVASLRKRDGTWISVAQHFDGRIGDRTCGDGVRVPDAPAARELRAIVCESLDIGIFTYVLTPNYNAAHADHYHMEIKPGVRWFLVH
jgi:hypothetical protein